MRLRDFPLADFTALEEKTGQWSNSPVPGASTARKAHAMVLKASALMATAVQENTAWVHQYRPGTLLVVTHNLREQDSVRRAKVLRFSKTHVTLAPAYEHQEPVRYHRVTGEQAGAVRGRAGWGVRNPRIPRDEMAKFNADPVAYNERDTATTE